MKVVDYHTSEDPDFECARCGRRVKRAVALQGAPPGLYGLDCAAVLMGRPRSRKTYEDLEVQGLKAHAVVEGARAGAFARGVLGPLPSKKDIGWTAYCEIVQRAFARFSTKEQSSNPWFIDAFTDAWRGK